jgi:hypothetical protein
VGSSGKKKTTMAKLARENRLRERRLNKQAKKDARKQASRDLPDASTPLEPLSAAALPPATYDREDAGDGVLSSGPAAKTQPIGLAPVGGDDPPTMTA